MKWIEIVELRTSKASTISIERFLGDWLNKIKKEEKQTRIKIYKRVFVETDISVHLFYESKSMKTGFSSLGAQLVSELKEFGLVNHSVWLEKL